MGPAFIKAASSTSDNGSMAGNAALAMARACSDRRAGAGQPRGPGGNGDRVIRTHAGQIRQGTGFNIGQFGPVPGTAHDTAHGDGAQGAWRDEDHLAVRQMGRHSPGNGILGRRGQGREYQFGVIQGLPDIRGYTM